MAMKLTKLAVLWAVHTRLSVLEREADDKKQFIRAKNIQEERVGIEEIIAETETGTKIAEEGSVE